MGTGAKKYLPDKMENKMSVGEPWEPEEVNHAQKA
jgi:hypothetical protein